MHWIENTDYGTQAVVLDATYESAEDINEFMTSVCRVISVSSRHQCNVSQKLSPTGNI